MFSLNVPLPPAIARFADDLHPKLSGVDRVRDRHTLVCKRFGAEDVPDRVDDGHTSPDPGEGSTPQTPPPPPPPPPPSSPPPSSPSPSPKSAALAALRDDLRPLLAGTDPFDVAVTGVDVFDAPASGSGPVIYLGIESDGLVRLHRRLCAAYGAIEGIEGEAYVPHVTLARGGNPEPGVVADLVAAEYEPIRWRVHALDLYDPEFREVAATIEL